MFRSHYYVALSLALIFLQLIGLEAAALAIPKHSHHGPLRNVLCNSGRAIFEGVSVTDPGELNARGCVAPP
ncbi:hypothetical protein PUNSTDRAFT_134179 [Punctularia strigosozonata HHB-11173 SS5]|uniref:uncharacterized protein n=1 Tax=Punctularia strigosozonata (strain HHB-11173) TaxID=741275 RepID=UPI000441667B|nr:uncharacterized protein PUNSTDRAFT_134179 [Punctularia strigosozonata HHB-11173 SS5]EIN09006.1 hypothetical protein PUNSTDRAFT_134179 [Punctularia strigosozonata HHB-11173 SS5]